MLTADLVVARRRGTELRLVKLDDAGRGRARAIATSLLSVVQAHVGETREDLEAAVQCIDVSAQDERLKAGLAKLLEDRCDWDEEGGENAPGLRNALFLRAAEMRRTLGDGQLFDRDALVAAAAREHEMEPERYERALYADLRGAQLLRGLEAMSAPMLVDAWERGQAQAVLLRAIKVTLDVKCASAGATRALFHRLKFLRLLHTVSKTDEGHRVVIDGPFSLFESVTKYGLQLALIVPLLDGCDAWRLEAEVRWGKERVPLVFKLEGEARTTLDEPPLPDEIAELVRAIERAESDWRVSPAKAILDLPGVGLCVPDLVFERGTGRSTERVYLEVMGFWSRDAVWRRVELVQSGMTAPILFAVSSRLRVSEDVLPEDATSALYVYKGTMNARALLARVHELSSRK